MPSFVQEGHAQRRIQDLQSISTSPFFTMLQAYFSCKRTFGHNCRNTIAGCLNCIHSVSGIAYFFKTIMSFDNILVVSLMSFPVNYFAMNLGEAGMFLAIGFVPTLIALEIVYRMGRAIGKRGEISFPMRHNELKSVFA
jgi:hypothetical protein